jgi:hypothetical protein
MRCHCGPHTAAVNGPSGSRRLAWANNRMKREKIIATRASCAPGLPNSHTTGAPTTIACSGASSQKVR